MSQAQVIARMGLMGTKASAVARLKSALADGRHSPSGATLRKYAQAVGKKLIIQLR